MLLCCCFAKQIFVSKCYGGLCCCVLVLPNRLLCRNSKFFVFRTKSASFVVFFRVLQKMQSRPADNRFGTKSKLLTNQRVSKPPGLSQPSHMPAFASELYDTVSVGTKRKVAFADNSDILTKRKVALADNSDILEIGEKNVDGDKSGIDDEIPASANSDKSGTQNPFNFSRLLMEVTDIPLIDAPSWEEPATKIQRYNTWTAETPESPDKHLRLIGDVKYEAINVEGCTEIFIPVGTSAYCQFKEEDGCLKDYTTIARKDQRVSWHSWWRYQRPQPTQAVPKGVRT